MEKEKIIAPCNHWADNLQVECHNCQNIIFCIDRAILNTEPEMMITVLRGHIVKLVGGKE